MSIRHIAERIDARPGLLPFAGALVAWTLVWTVFGVEDVLTQTAIGAGRAGASIEVHEILQALFVAAHTGVRWAGGMAVLLVGGLVVRHGMRDSRESRAG